MTASKGGGVEKLFRSSAGRTSFADTSDEKVSIVATSAKCLSNSALLVLAAGAGASTMGWQQEPDLALSPSAGFEPCSPAQQLLAEQQL